MTQSQNLGGQEASGAPYYRPLGDECAVFETAYKLRLPLLLKGPTGCGKTRFVSHMAAKLGLPIFTIACHDDLNSADLTGRYLLKGGDTAWADGPLTRAVREGGICYIDEVVEARKDVTVVLHPLTDDRRILPLERTGETLRAPDNFMLVVSYNPGYQNILKTLKPSTRQRFLAMAFDYPPAEAEAEIVEAETGIDRGRARLLVRLARQLRSVKDYELSEGASTRLVIYCASLVHAGMAMRQACEVALIEPLSDDEDVKRGLRDVVSAVIG